MPIDDMLKYYQFKYPSSNPLIALKGLTYFDDIDEQVDKPILLKKVTMKQLKKRLQEAVLYTEKIFDPSA